MEILAIHSTINIVKWDDQDDYLNKSDEYQKYKYKLESYKNKLDDSLNDFYKNLLEYCIEKNHYSGYKALKILDEIIDNVYYQNQDLNGECNFNKIIKVKKIKLYRKYIITDHILDITMYRIFFIPSC